jgi:hypothetical protein
MRVPMLDPVSGNRVELIVARRKEKTTCLNQ